MSSTRDNLAVPVLFCAIVALVLVPGICVAVDEYHPHRDPTCPFCNVILTYVAVIALAAVVFALAAQRERFTLPGLEERSWMRGEHGGPPPARGPPLRGTAYPDR